MFQPHHSLTTLSRETALAVRSISRPVTFTEKIDQAERTSPQPKALRRILRQPGVTSERPRPPGREKVLMSEAIARRNTTPVHRFVIWRSPLFIG